MKNKIYSALILSGASGLLFGQKQQPNIIYILADDLGYGDLGCYGQKKIKTPNIDRLAENGMLFTQHYAGSTVSAPSRSCLLTGLHTGHTPIRGNKEAESGEGQMPLPANTSTIASLLKAEGYTTGAFGKWGLGFPGSTGDPLNSGFDYFYGFNCQREAHHAYPDHLYDNHERVKLQGNQNNEKQEYAQDLIHQHAMAFIRRNAGKSFFAFLPYVLPHAELATPDDSIPDNYRGKIQERKPYIGSKQGYGTSLTPHADFASMVTRLDAYVGEVVSELKKAGIEKNTIIIFSSDNGPHREGGGDPDFFDSNGNFRGIKRDLYEGGIRVPMIVSWPGTVAPKQESNHISAFWDILPTIKELCGSKKNIQTDGISLYPTLLGKSKQKQHKFLYWEFHEEGGKVALRYGKWKGIKLKYGTSPDAPLELYDLNNDPAEQYNVASQHPETVKKIEKLIRSARTSSIFNFGK